MTFVVGPPGLLIAIEGIDGAGKTTQAALLVEALREAGLTVVRSKEPTDGPWGAKLRASASTERMSLEDELAAFIADRREHVAALIQPALQRGEIVILDRYYFSTAAYQGARGGDPDAILAENEAFAPRPDLLLLLDVNPTVGVQRIRERGDVANLFEREEDLRRSAVIFSRLEGDHVLRLDGRQPKEAIRDATLRRVYELLFPKMCAKAHYKNACEPEYCSLRIDGRCDFPKLGVLSPLPIRA